MVLFAAGAWVWLEHGEDAFIPVQMVKQVGDRIIAKAATSEQYELDAKASYPEVHPSSLRAVENMVSMEELSEAAILHNLRLRFADNLIYTHISSILVSINPFKQLPIYSPAIMKDYRERLARMERVAPHVYALADAAFTNLRGEERDQSVIISGESGAGKTEATKLVLQYMAEMSGQGNDVEQQLLSSNPIIEAFGNAKTVRNNNSSRFGKLVEIKFNDRYHIIGAEIRNYLLEKSRIVVPGLGERNYHLFYQLCAGASPAERTRWCLDHAGKFRILSVGGCLEVDGTDDAEEWTALRNALDILAFSAAEVDDIMRTTSACLHLGNVDFTQNQRDEAAVSTPDAVQTAAALLRVDVQSLVTSLISQRKQMGRESILTVRSRMLAEAARDALTKKIYSHLFDWLIVRINKTLAARSRGANKTVGVLDIFGFEIFQTNRFEQFCINFANERMQSHFNAHVFQMEQSVYAEERIDVAHVSYVDNQPCLDLIEAGRTSILGMTDEELRLPGGGDDNLLTRMHQAHAANAYYTKPKTAVPLFVIAHYAGPVEYTIDGFVEKNRDSLEANIAEVLQASASPFVAQLLPAQAAVGTLGSQFKAQLAKLMDTLNKTSPHFIRCIKSNNVKVADTFDSMMVLRQLRYLGLKEVVNIRQLGYPIRRDHTDFVRRYGLLHPTRGAMSSSKDYRALAQSLLMAALPDAPASDWRVGVSKVFLRQNLATQLESARERQLTAVTIKLQSLARTKIWRARFLKVKGAIEHLKRSMENPSSTPEQIDAAISAYEGLRFKTNTKLIQAAIKIRNRLFEQSQARAAVTSALKAMDIETMRTAIFVADKALLSDEEFEPLRRIRVLFKQLQEYRAQLEEAIRSKDMDALRAALERAKSLSVNGSEEKRAQSLLQTLEEEARTAARLAAEKRDREIALLKKALSAAMTAKSGAMLEAAIKKALADPSLQLATDPLLLQAQKLIVSLDKEVKVFALATELKAAIDSEDVEILESTIATALAKGFQSHALTVQAQQSVVVLRKRADLLKTLTAAVASKNETAVKLALAAVGSPANLAEFPTLTDAPEFKSAQAMLAGVSASKVNKSAADAASKSAAEAHAIESLRNAIESNNQQLLEGAIAAAKAAGASKDSEGALGEQFVAASKLLTSIAAESALRRQELLHANAAVAAETKRNARRSMIMTNQKTLLASQLTEERFADLSLDESVYCSAEFLLENYPDLRSVNDFASDKKNLRMGMLHHSKELIPKSLLRFEAQGSGVSSLLSPSAKSGSGAASAAGMGGDVWSQRFLSEKAVEIFKMVQGFMTDRQYSFPDTLVTELMHEILLYPALRNEVYAQLLKQLTNNAEHIESWNRGWTLMCILVDTVPPLSDFLHYVLHFIHLHAINAGAVLGGGASPMHVETASLYAAYALHKLKLTCTTFNFQAPAKDSPELATALAQKEAGQPVQCLAPFAARTSVEHVAAFRERTMHPAVVRVHMSDGSAVDRLTSPWETNAQVVLALCELVAVRDPEHFALFEQRGVDQMYLYATENLLDVQLQWSKQERREAAKKSKGFFSSLFSKKETKADDHDDWAANPGVRRFVLRRRIFTKDTGHEPAGALDKREQSLLFFTVQTEVALGLHVADEEHALRLATIARTLRDSGVLKPLGSVPRVDPAHTEASDVWAQCRLDDVPAGALAKKINAKTWCQKMDKLQLSLAGQGLDLWTSEARTLSTFGCAFFSVVHQSDATVPIKLPSELTVAINYFGLRLIDRKTNSVVEHMHFPLLNILGWSSSPIRFVVRVKLNKPAGPSGAIGVATFRFATYNPKLGKEMCDLLYSYATEMLRAVGIKQS